MAKIRKAVLAALGAAATGLGAALADGDLTSAELGTLAGLAIAAALAVWRVPNAPQS